MSATVIDALIVTLALDPRNFERGKQSANKGVKDLKQGAKDAGDEFRKSAKKVAEFFLGFESSRAIVKFIDDVTTSNAQLARLSDRLDTSAGDLRAWGLAAERNGGSAAGFQQTIQHLSMAMTEIATTGDAAVLPFFRSLQVSMGDSTGHARPFLDILQDLPHAFERFNVSKANQFNLLQQMGIDEGTANLMIQGSAAFDQVIKRMKLLAPLTKEQAENSLKLKNEVLDLKFAAMGFSNELIALVTPALISFFEGLSAVGQWMREHPAVIEVVAAAITSLFIPAILEAASAIWLMMAPFLPLIAGLTAIGAAVALVADDWYTWAHGGRSALEGLWNYMESIGHKIESWFGWIGGIFSGGFAGMKTAAGNLLDNSINGIVDFFKSHGWTTNQAVGIAANLQAESGLNAGAVGDGGKARGIAQWHPDRQAAYEKWSGKSFADSSLADQLRFVQHELTDGSERGAGNRLRATTGHDDAARVVSQYYERPGDRDGEAEKRAGIAARIAAGIPGAQAAANVPAVSGGGGTNVSTSVTIGKIDVHTQATDANGIAAGIGDALRSRGLANQADYGVN